MSTGVGDVFAERYRLESELGRGGFATVFEATDLASGKRVALKILRVDGDEDYDPRTRARFTREVEILRGLESTHTVRLLDAGIASGLLYMVSELLPGQDLAELVGERGTLTPGEVEGILHQLLMALHEAHQKGLLHRDIKPENVRVARRGDRWHATLLDFGIARAVDRGSPKLTKTGELIGTPRYMAPEQLIDQELTASSDLYSLGIAMIELVVGREQLHGNRWGDQLDRLRPDHVFAFPELDESMLAGVLRAMTAREPRDRPQSALDVLDALDRSDTTTTKLAPSREAPKDRQGYFWIVVLGLVGGVVLVLVLTNSTEPDLPQPALDRRIPGIVGRADAATVQVTQLDAGTDSAMVRCADKVPFTGLGRMQLEIGLASARPWAYIPPSHAANGDSPLLVVLHQTAEEPKNLIEHTGFIPLADRDGWVIVMPQDDLFAPWVDAESLDRVARIVAQVQESMCIDSKRVFLVGQGQGGRAAATLGCEPWVRAVATNSFRSGIEERLCPDAPKPRIMLSPMNSPREPIGGGEPACESFLKGSPGALKSLAEEENAVKRRNGCSDSGKPIDAEPRCRRWACAEPFVSCHVPGGHGWPGAPPRRLERLHAYSKEYLEDCDGTPQPFPTGELIWDFFKNLPERTDE